MIENRFKTSNACTQIIDANDDRIEVKNEKLFVTINLFKKRDEDPVMIHKNGAIVLIEFLKTAFNL